jgi:hypothetical protein
MDNHAAIKDLLERDGRFRLAHLGHFYLDPIRDPLEGREPIFGAVIKGRHEVEEGVPSVIVPLAEEFAGEDPEVVARALLSVAGEKSTDMLDD